MPPGSLLSAAELRRIKLMLSNKFVLLNLPHAVLATLRIFPLLSIMHIAFPYIILAVLVQISLAQNAKGWRSCCTSCKVAWQVLVPLDFDIDIVQAAMWLSPCPVCTV